MTEYTALNPAPYAEHKGPGHVVNLAGTHRGNRFCTTCQVPVGMPDFDEDQASAAVPVVAVVVGRAAMLQVQNWAMFRAFHTRATSPGGMQLTRNFRATVKGFNEAYGFNCRNWAEVAEITKAIYAERDQADKARREADR